MKKYISPVVGVMNAKVESPVLAASNGKLTGGGSNAGQVHPTAESKGFGAWDDDIWMDDAD